MFPFSHYPNVNVPLIAGGGGPLPDVEVVSTAFTASNGTSVDSFALTVGGTIDVVSGTMEIQGNAAIVTSGSADAIVYTKYGAGRVGFLFKCGAANGNFAPSLIFGGVQTDRYMMAYFSGDGALQIYRRNVGTFTAVETGSWSADASWHLGEVEFYEGAVEVFIDGVSALTYTMDEANDWFGTIIGFRGFTFGSDEDAFDDFTFTVPGEMEWQDYPGELGAGFTDDFGDANGTSLTTTGWSNQLGTWTTQGGVAVNGTSAGATSGYTVVYDTGETDHGAEVVVHTHASDDFIPGIAARWVDADHFVEGELNSRPGYSGYAGSGVWWYDGTIFHPIMTNYLVPTHDTSYTLRMWTRGDYIFYEVVEAGIQMAAKFSQYPTATKVGLFEANSTGDGIGGNTFNDFEVIS